MSSATVALVAAAIFLWGACSARLQRADLTAPIVFVAVGLILSWLVTPARDVEAETVKLATEVTLVWVLFSDAARVGFKAFRRDAGMYVRLLGIALPITIGLGCLLARALFGGFDWWLALLVGAALAPTDAALGAAVIANPAVPARIRGILNVESGLNDGIATPVVLIALAGAASAATGTGVGHPALGLLLGAAVGVGVGAAGAVILRITRRRGWVDEEFGGPAILALALLAYAASVAIDGNGFVAAFAGGLAFGALTGRRGPKAVFYVEQTAGLAAIVVWTLFGFVAVPLVIDASGWRLVLYAVSSLTVARIVPVALVLLGTDLDRRAALFIGWFGPRGLASVVFALMAVEQLGADADAAVAVIVTTVLLSVVAHGLTAEPLAARYARVCVSGGTSAGGTPTVRGRRTDPGRPARRRPARKRPTAAGR